MPLQRYNVTQPHIETLFSWINTGEVAIPEIQRPFVWNATKVRNFLDSLYQGYPVGYLICWKNPDVKLKDGTLATGKRILIDGQQRVTALMTALLGYEVVDKDYRHVKIRIAFQPMQERFEVSNSAIEKDSSWIPDVSIVFHKDTKIFDLVSAYCKKNPSVDRDDLFKIIERMRSITSNQIGLIELDSELDIETVTEIFIRVNSAGVPLGQADFAMSKIAVNETYGGNMLRKAIDYFCHLTAVPEFYDTIKQDVDFEKSVFFKRITWKKDENEDIYVPSYTDMLRVAFASKFRRGRLEDLVALLSGRNFETRQYEEAIVESSFDKLQKGILQFVNETHFKRFVMIIRSAGFIDSSLMGSQNALNFAYILYLILREKGIPNADIELYVSCWYVMSILTGRYSTSPETTIDSDIRQIEMQGIDKYAKNQIKGELSDAFWETVLPQSMETSVVSSPYFRLFCAAQIKMNDRGFLSKDHTVRELIEVKSDIHHIFPKSLLKKQGLSRGQYNQIANYVITQSEINISIGNKEPSRYFAEVVEQCNGGTKKYGNISSINELEKNLQMNAIPKEVMQMSLDDYQGFLAKRREYMAKKIQDYFKLLSAPLF